MVLAALNSFALQFTSTLLLSDFGSSTVVLKTNDTNVFFGLNDSSSFDLSSGANYWTSAPSAYWRYAEYSEPPHQAPNYVDVGRTLRAYLPFINAEQRQTLRNYSGPATISDARTICIKPPIEIYHINNISYSYPDVYGKISLANLTYPGLKFAEGGGGSDKRQVNGQPTHIDFSCPIYRQQSVLDSGFWSTSLCDLDLAELGAELESIFDTDEVSSSPGWIEARPWLLFNSTPPSNSSSGSNINFTSSTIHVEQSGSGPWLNVIAHNSANEDAGFRLNVSLCFTIVGSAEYNIKAWTQLDAIEPNIEWSRDSRRYDTLGIRRMLGATSESRSLADRGLLSLQPVSNWSAVTVQGSENNVDRSIEEVLDWIHPDNKTSALPGMTMVLAPPPYEKAPGQIHGKYITLVNDILKDTQNPALALQALFTLLQQMKYYDQLPQFDLSSSASTTFSSTVLIPKQWTGFIVIVVLLAVQLLLVITAIVLFMMKTNASLLGNAWQAIAQVSAADTTDILAHAPNMTDGEVKRLLKDRALDKETVVLRTGVDNAEGETVYRHRSDDHDSEIHSSIHAHRD